MNFAAQNDDISLQDMRTMEGSRTGWTALFGSSEPQFIRPQLLHFVHELWIN
jgi:hypothetical protein